MTDEPMGKDLMDECSKDVTLDSFFDGDPRTKDMHALVVHLRNQRALFIKGKGAGRANAAATTETDDDA